MSAAEFGIRIPGGEVLDPCPDRSEAEARLTRYRDCWPEAQLVVRRLDSVEWEPAAPEDPPIPR